MRSKEFYTSEKKLSKKQKSKKEKYVKGMKKSAKDFKARYGDDYKSVMYATATKMAKEDISEKGRIVLEKAGFGLNLLYTALLPLFLKRVITVGSGYLGAAMTNLQRFALMIQLLQS